MFALLYIQELLRKVTFLEILAFELCGVRCFEIDCSCFGVVFRVVYVVHFFDSFFVMIVKIVYVMYFDNV